MELASSWLSAVEEATRDGSLEELDGLPGIGERAGIHTIQAVLDVLLGQPEHGFLLFSGEGEACLQVLPSLHVLHVLHLGVDRTESRDERMDVNELEGSTFVGGDATRQDVAQASKVSWLTNEGLGQIGIFIHDDQGSVALDSLGTGPLQDATVGFLLDVILPTVMGTDHHPSGTELLFGELLFDPDISVQPDFLDDSGFGVCSMGRSEDGEFAFQSILGQQVLQAQIEFVGLFDGVNHHGPRELRGGPKGVGHQPQGTDGLSAARRGHDSLEQWVVLGLLDGSFSGQCEGVGGVQSERRWFLLALGHFLEQRDTVVEVRVQDVVDVEVGHSLGSIWLSPFSQSPIRAVPTTGARERQHCRQCR